MSKIVITTAYCLFFFGFPVELLRGEVLIHGGSGSTWSLNEDGKETGADWIKPGYDDSRWRRGAGPFGFGESGITTEVTPGGNGKAVRTTTYFRTTFDGVSPEAVAQLLLTVRADDGVSIIKGGNRTSLGSWGQRQDQLAKGDGHRMPQTT